MEENLFSDLKNEEKKLLIEREAIEKRLQPIIRIGMKQIQPWESPEPYYYAPKTPEQIKDMDRRKEIATRLGEIYKALGYDYLEEWPGSRS